VLTGCALYLPEIGMKVFCDQADVIFKKLSDEEIESYLDLEEWKGAAGGYRLQKNGWKLVEKIEGDWTTVVGLPLERLIELKKSFNQEARRNAPAPAEESL
ncbi:MAG: Maf family protein, partial [Spirochaetales bacterium]|nr:Maf family protein [Spirochaetales bacterium]